MVVVPAATAPAVAPAIRSTTPQAAPTLQDLKNSIEELKKEQNQIRKTLEELKRARPAAVQPEPERGKIVLEMPDDALVVLNDKPVPSNAVFRTPLLGPGKQQVVNIEAAVVRDGKSINRVKQLTLHGGEVV